MKNLFNLLICSGYFIAFVVSVSALPGDLDRTFANNGISIISIGAGGGARATVGQSDGKIISAGVHRDASSNSSVALIRYNYDGSRDSSFGNNGIVTTQIGQSSGVTDVALQSNGKIVVVGVSNNDFLVVRYNTNGSLDSSFGLGGIVLTPIGTSVDVAHGVIIQNDGKIVVAGLSRLQGNNFSLARYSTNGSLDTSFGFEGKVVTPIGIGNDASGRTVTIQSDGKIVVSGEVRGNDSYNDFGTIRYNPNGSLDESFGNGGKVITSFGFASNATDNAVQTDGKIIVVGTNVTTLGTPPNFALARYNHDGSLDKTFGSNGQVITALGSGNSEANTVTIDLNGKLIVAGSSSSNQSAPSTFALARYNTNGSLDTSFNKDGIVFTEINSDNSFIYDSFLQSNRKLVVVGGNGFIAARYNLSTNNSFLDFDGDNRTDISIFRPSVGEWWYLRSIDGENRAFQFGSSSDQITPADYTGDDKTDIAFWRESSGEWFILRSEDFSFYAFPFGQAGDIPAPGDFDGDGKADAAVFRPADATWYILRSSDGGITIQQFGVSEDKPVVADYDGDGKDDIGIYRPSVSEWWILRSNAGLKAVQFGSIGDKTVPGDYTGDGKADAAFYRPSTGEWFILRSEDDSYYAFPFGAAGDIPAPGDYDGDGKFDAAVFRPSNSTWYLLQSTNGFGAITFGATGDIPVPNVVVR